MKALLLSAILGLSLFAQANNEQQIISEQIKEAQTITKRWMQQQKQGTNARDLYAGNPEKADYLINGIPAYVKQINPKGIVFRHYVGKAMPIVLETRQLKTGITPYIIMNPGYSREVYQDLVGIFLTTPNTPPEKVGLPRDPNYDYIDFTLYDGTPVVQIEKEILLIPGRPDMPEWLKTLYFEYRRTGRADSKYIETFKRADERGGVNPTFMKVNIKSYRLNGKVYKL